ncbi:type VII secretion protein EccB [Mycobacterium aquaticum]|uniref:Type VII secretion protein EccB n=1 Tax=Mycobacterium aquaticum TaxID=1927124 RepID=A0A1X0B223_9MYCO|nr:type VII secretion protein EccB [Mycobacterium aquaticum]ORA36229.1 type VII secretion protein EccB [Mycobacterium aquaticum]
MPAQITTRAQVNGYRFLLRRLEHALIRGDSRMIHDPMRGQTRSLLVGLVIAMIIVGGCGVLAFFKPSPAVGNAHILLSKTNGAMFVRIGDRAHPVLNLASARLITASSEAPVVVDDKKLAALDRGPVVGIVGAPLAIAPGVDPVNSNWTVCDTTEFPSAIQGTGSRVVRTTVIAGPTALSSDTHVAAAPEAALVRADNKHYLLFDGVRAPIDVADPVLMNALHLTTAEVRDVSEGLLNAFPLVAPITAITVPDAGAPAPAPLPDTVRVGSIVKTSDTSGEQLYVVLTDGVQPITAATADIIRYGDPSARREPESLSPAVLTGVPKVQRLAVDHYPTVVPTVAGVRADPVVCFTWRRSTTDTTAATRMIVGRRLPIAEQAATVPMAGADGSGPALDAVYFKPGTGEYVRAVGMQPDAEAMGQLFYIADTGQRFHLKDAAAAAALGVHGSDGPDGAQGPTPQLAPWSVISLLPAGPELSRDAALIAHDGMQADAAGSVVAVPTS